MRETVSQCSDRQLSETGFDVSKNMRKQNLGGNGSLSNFLFCVRVLFGRVTCTAFDYWIVASDGCDMQI